jgi:hypothetical protein
MQETSPSKEGFMKSIRMFVLAALAGAALQAHAVGQLVDLVVVDRTDNVRLPVYWHEGRAFVAGKPGNEYSVSVRSRQGTDVLAVVSVDGVNVVTGESASPRQSGYVLSPGRSVDILGWRKNLSETAAFYFTSLGDSYAGRTGRPDDVGVIGVAVFRRKVEPPVSIQPIAPPAHGRRDAPRPFAESGAGASADSAAPAAREAHAPGELASRSEKLQAAPGAPIGTGHGRREVSHARHVGFERASRTPAETIVLHYDSRANLVARGVIRDAYPVAPRHPRPFPGFVPDPVSGGHPPWLPSFGS